MSNPVQPKVQASTAAALVASFVVGLVKNRVTIDPVTEDALSALVVAGITFASGYLTPNKRGEHAR